MTDHLTKNSFTENLNTRFRLTPLPDKNIELELIEVTEKESLRAAGVESFSAFFRGPANFYLPQAIYPMEHDALGHVEIFIVPIRQDQNGFYYEAVFNRIIS